MQHRLFIRSRSQRLLRRLCTMLFASAAIAASAHASSGKPVTLVFPGPPGGGGDAVARAMADEMGKATGQVHIVENRPGASGTLGTAAVARAEPDGRTLLITAHVAFINAPLLLPSVPFDVKRDLAFVSELCSASLLFLVHKDVPVRNMKEFMDWANANKGKVTYGSFSIGSVAHLMGAYLSKSRDLEMNHVAYKGEAPMVQDLIGQQIHWALATPGTAMPHVASGRLRALAVASNTNTRLAASPELPTMAEAGLPDQEFQQAVGCIAVLAPSRTPPETLAEIEKKVRAAVHSPAVKTRLQAIGMEPLGNSSEEFRKRYESALPIIEKMIRVSGAKVE